MEQWIDALFSESLLEEAANRFGTTSAEAEKRGDFENYIYEVHKKGKPYILRLTHSSHRSGEDIQAELEWVNFLHKNGANVSVAYPSIHGELVEEIGVEGSSFSICLFDKAPGTLVKMDDERFGPELFQSWGQAVGHMHKVTKGYKAGNHKRDRWDEDDLLTFSKYLDQNKDKAIIAEGEKVVRELQSFPETEESFGLIHSDIHPGNFFYHEGDIHIFDFDDSTYHFYVSDIAIPVYYPIWWKHREDALSVRSAYGEEVLYDFLVGYLKENRLDLDWIKKIPSFLKLRDIELYTVFQKKWEPENRNEKEQQLVDGIRDRIVRDEPLIELDYEKIYQRALGEAAKVQ
ncbi:MULTISPECIES: phosphotransferase enzyme family protein [Pontibacillus]|uniref:Phosphotransferase n=1 Tax=Pontibacillus chungwhensis TaxID=265426 RepID=A0ABY8V415_9BACI|nr:MULTISPECIES: phosphotransferase [Pontibacillus]MCD5324346.1 phosphotransferase [Pontibacillus sp. HN14]WIF99355.1 phosphotransferase [Pontibacillus chungwhensis]